jgi:hypothetical protein
VLIFCSYRPEVIVRLSFSARPARLDYLSLRKKTGGIPEIVRDGENGFLLPLSAKGAAYAKVIANVYRDDERYIQLKRGCRAAFDAKLNWDAWGVATKRILAQLLDRESSSQQGEELPGEVKCK